MNKSSLLRTALASTFSVMASNLVLAQSSRIDSTSMTLSTEEDGVVLRMPFDTRPYNHFYITCPNNPRATSAEVTADMDHASPEYLKQVIEDPEAKKAPPEELTGDWYDHSSGLIGTDGTIYPAYNYKELTTQFEDALKNPEKLQGTPINNKKAQRAVMDHARTVCLKAM